MSLRKPKAPVLPYRGPGAVGTQADSDPYAVLSMHQASCSFCFPMTWSSVHTCLSIMPRILR